MKTLKQEKSYGAYNSRDEGDLVGTGHDRQTHNIQTYGRRRIRKQTKTECQVPNISGFGAVLIVKTAIKPKMLLAGVTGLVETDNKTQTQIHTHTNL